MYPDHSPFVVVQARSPQARLIHFETHGFDQMQSEACVGTQSYNVPRVRWDLGFEQDDVYHGRPE